MVIAREDDVTHSVSVYLKPEKFVTFSMEDRDGSEFSLVLAGYHRLLTGMYLIKFSIRAYHPQTIAYFIFIRQRITCRKRARRLPR